MNPIRVQAILFDFDGVLVDSEPIRFTAGARALGEIGEALTISENTVKFHTKHILDKLHLRSRAEVVAYASRQAKAP